MQPDQGLLDDLVRRIREVVEPKRIVLFGSSARGEMTPDSDLDVLVVVDNATDPRSTTRAIYRRLIGFGQAVDVIVATDKEVAEYGDRVGMVYYPALREGRGIYAA